MTDLVSLQSPRLQLRWFIPDDAELLLRIWNTPDFHRYVGDRGIRTVAQAEEVLRKGILSWYDDFGMGPYRIGLPDSTGIGICGLFYRDEFDHPDLGFGLLPEYYRRGYAEEAAIATLAVCDYHLRLPVVNAIVSPDNPRSVHLLEKLGFVFLETYRFAGEDDDVHLYQRARQA